MYVFFVAKEADLIFDHLTSMSQIFGFESKPFRKRAVHDDGKLPSHIPVGLSVITLAEFPQVIRKMRYSYSLLHPRLKETDGKCQGLICGGTSSSTDVQHQLNISYL